MRKFIVMVIVVAIVLIGGNVIINNKDAKSKISVNKENAPKKMLTLVNRKNPIEKNYNLNDLREVNVRFIKSSTDEEKLLKDEAASALENLFEAAKRDNIILYGNSGYRSEETQKKIYDKKKKVRGAQYAKQYVAKSKESEHLTGLAIDITNSERNFYEESKEARWIQENAHKYGFILRYPKGKEDITGFNYEPWHIRYVGTKYSKIIYNKKLTLEEYLQEE